MEQLNNNQLKPEYDVNIDDHQDDKFDDRFERIDATQYTSEQISRKMLETVYPFMRRGNESFLSAAAFVVAALYFIAPCFLALYRLVMPRLYDFATLTTLKAFSIISIVFLVWAALGTLEKKLYNKEPLSKNYSSIGELIKCNFSRLALIVVLVLMTIASYRSANRVNAFENLTDGTFVYYRIFLGCLCISLIKKPSHKKILLTLFVISTVAMSVLVYNQYVTEYLSVSMNNVFKVNLSSISMPAIRIRYMRGIFDNSNHCGYYLVLGAMAASGLLVTADKLWKKILYGLALAVILNVIVLNNTLGAVLATVLTIILLPLFFIKSQHKIIARFVPLFILIFVFGFITLFPSLPTGTNNLKEYAKEFTSVVKIISGKPDENAPSNTPAPTPEKQEHSSENTTVSSEVAFASGTSDSGLKATDSALSEPVKSAAANATDSDLKATDSALSEPVKSAIANASSGIISALPTPPPQSTEQEEQGGWWLKHQELGTNRLGLWQYGIELIRHKPLLGYGSNGTATLFEKESGLKEPAARVHNEYLQIAIDYGVPAMLIYLTALISAIVCFFKRMVNEQLTDNARILFAMVIGYCISAFFGIAAYYTVNFFLLILALLLTELNGKQEDELTPCDACCNSADSLDDVTSDDCCQYDSYNSTADETDFADANDNQNDAE